MSHTATGDGELVEMKIVMVGDISVGKTSIVARFIQNTFADKQQPTIGASYMAKEAQVLGRRVRFAVWDTAGQEAYHSLVPMYFRQAAAVVLVYDITNAKSLGAVRKWAAEVADHAPSGVIVALAGNKSDKPDERAVPGDDAEGVAHDVGAFHQETSAKTGDGVDTLFEQIAKRHLRRLPERKPPSPPRGAVRPGEGGGDGRRGCRC